MNEVKIQIPDNCELIKDGDTYIVREKKQGPPRSWEEFYEKYPVKPGEAYIMPGTDEIYTTDKNYDGKRLGRRFGKTWCTSKQEAEAFLALMQLRQLRKAWVEDWDEKDSNTSCIKYGLLRGLYVCKRNGTSSSMSFPTEEMAKDFLDCFRDLCETARILL